MKTRFYILRHGETEWNKDNNRYCGRTDIPLSATGYEQANKAAVFLKNINFEATYASPLQRAQETASIIAKYHSLQVSVDDQLLEIDFGMWEGKTKQDIQKEMLASWNQWNEDPTQTRAGETGETALEVYERANSFFQEKGQRHVGHNVLVVGHNTLNRLFLTGTLSVPFNKYRKFIQSNTGISIMEFDDGQMEWIQLNSIMHTLQ